MKYHLCHDGNYVRLVMMLIEDEEIYHCLLKALYMINVADIRGWYHYCSYV
jgi:hypothetical protein